MIISDIIPTKTLGTILIASIVVIVLLLIFLIIKGKKIKKKTEEKNWNAFYISEIRKIDLSHSRKTLNSLDKITRNFFREAFKIRKFVGYSELKKTFSKKNDPKAVEFCDLMSKSLYSKEEDGEKIQRLTNLLIEIIRKNKITEGE